MRSGPPAQRRGFCRNPGSGLGHQTSLRFGLLPQNPCEKLFGRFSAVSHFRSNLSDHIGWFGMQPFWVAHGTQ